MFECHFKRTVAKEVEEWSYKSFEVCMFDEEIAVLDDELHQNDLFGLEENFTLHGEKHVAWSIADNLFEKSLDLRNLLGYIRIQHLSYRLEDIFLHRYPFVNHLFQKSAIQSNDLLIGV